MTMEIPTDTPQTVKALEAKRSGAVDTLSEFWDWMHEHGYWVGEWVQIEGHRDKSLLPTSKDPARIFAEFFGIDLNALEAEKRAMLADLAAKTESG